MSDTSNSAREPSFLDSLIPIIILVTFLGLSVYIFGEDSSYGPNQIALVMAAAIAALIGYKNGHKWEDIHNGLLGGIHMAMGAVLILLAVGMLIGTWILSGTVPTMLTYGLELMSPTWFYPASCLVSAIVAISIGSSWSTAGTIGVGLIGVAEGLDLNPAIAAGAIISGAYMGDKMSPLSDTTNLAPSVAGSELFSHIRHMTWTTVPAFVISLILFTILGLQDTVVADTSQVDALTVAINSEFNTGIHLLIPMVILFALARAKVPALAAVLCGAFVGVLFALIFQQDAVIKLAGDSADLATPFVALKGVWMASFDGYKANTGLDSVNTLLSKGGMSSMLVTVWLIISALAFGGVMEKVGLLRKFVSVIIKRVHTTSGLIASTLGTAFGVNLIASDQYMSVVIPGRMFKEEYERRGLDPLNLSRALEDAGTVTSVLVPWNTCGAFMAVTLGVHTFSYLPYAFFNILSPIIGLIFALTMFKVLVKPKQDEKEAAETAA